VQFLELYGDEIRDLLDYVSVDKTTGTSTKTLKITEAKNGSISVTGLKAELVNSKAECISLLNKGIAKRMTAQTQMNEASSRSHAIFTVTIE
jgi:centromeric protein E